MGDELAESYTGKKSAERRATQLRKTFTNVEIRETELHVGYNAPKELKRN